MPEEELESYPEEGEEVVEEGGVELEEKTTPAETESQEMGVTEIEEIVEYSKVDPELIEATLVATDILDSLASGRLSIDEVMQMYNEKVAVVAESKIVKVKGSKKKTQKKKKAKKSKKSKGSKKKSKPSSHKSSS